MKPNPPTKQAARLPKARVMWLTPHTPSRRGQLHISYNKQPDYQQPYCVAVLPCRTVTEARALIRVAGFFAMGEGEQIQSLRRLFMEVDAGKAPYTVTARAVLNLISKTK